MNLFETLGRRLDVALNKPTVKFNTWWRTRSVKDTVRFPLIVDGEDRELEMSANVYKTLVFVEESILIDDHWTRDHYLAFVDGVLALYETGKLDETHLKMFLHPEAYMTGMEFVIDRTAEEEK